MNFEWNDDYNGQLHWTPAVTMPNGMEIALNVDCLDSTGHVHYLWTLAEFIAIDSTRAIIVGEADNLDEAKARAEAAAKILLALGTGHADEVVIRCTTALTEMALENVRGRIVAA